MKRNINLLGIAFLILAFFAFSGLDCESTGTELRIIGTDSFSGYYIINGGDENPITATSQNNLYIFKKDLGVFRFIEITATKDNPTAAMDLYLYDANGNLIQKVNNPACFSHHSTCANTASSTMSYNPRGGNSN